MHTATGRPEGPELDHRHTRQPGATTVRWMLRAQGMFVDLPAAFMPALSPPLVRTAMRRLVLRAGLGTVRRISGVLGLEFAGAVSSPDETDMVVL